jgi:hypothetical protein
MHKIKCSLHISCGKKFCCQCRFLSVVDETCICVLFQERLKDEKHGQYLIAVRCAECVSGEKKDAVNS